VEPLPIAAGAVLRPYKETDAAELTAVIAANRDHLARRLPWATSYGHQDSVDFIERKFAQIEADDGFEGAIELDGRIAGGAGFHRVDWINRTTSIGYWLAAESQGRGGSASPKRGSCARRS
jgi:ribosomal-protein-serine acetyltransferase